MPRDPRFSRKQVLTTFALSAAAAIFPAEALGQTPATKPVDKVTTDDIKILEKVSGLNFTEDERKEILDTVRSYRGSFEQLRQAAIKENTSVSLAYVPADRPAQGDHSVKANVNRRRDLRRLSPDSALAFMSVGDLGQLIRNRQLTSVELTQLYISRLKKYGDTLLAVVTLMEASALQEAAQADADLKNGLDRGPLHGIPYGAKDLFAAKGAPTTWGADPYKAQMLDYDAAIVERLRAAGAVLVAKLSMGSLAQGDVWFKGTTKNPWNMKQGSSGSSAGSAAATAAGLVAFGIGTETSGSILSPSQRCRVTGLRPTFGRVSRYGAMELSFSLDRIGPICREAEDCALVLAALCGSDARDPSAVDRPFFYPPKLDIDSLRIGWVGSESGLANDPAAKRLKELKAQVVPVKVAPFPSALFTILNVEAASAFDNFTRSDLIHGLKNSSWPQTFRSGRFVPGVEYLQAQRVRTLMMRQFEKDVAEFDFLLGPGIGGQAFNHANFCGYPSIAIPFGDDGNGNSVSKALIGKPYDEARLIVLAKALQDSFEYHRHHPDLEAAGSAQSG